MWDPIEQKIIDIIDSKKDEIIAFGDDIWHHAELGYKEVRTAGKYCEWMKKLGLENEEGWAITGVKTYLNPKGSTEGPTLAVMGEMDALPFRTTRTLGTAIRTAADITHSLQAL